MISYLRQTGFTPPTTSVFPRLIISLSLLCYKRMLSLIDKKRNKKSRRFKG